MRHVILHNHLFKNAGTSVDQILLQNFGRFWVSREFQRKPPGSTDQVADWIKAHPKAVAFSSHTLWGPLPQIDDVTIIPITLLRDPVERVVSAYRFEKAQQAETRGAMLAKKHGFAGYVHARLAIKGDRQCQNFQTDRLAALSPKSAASDLRRAQSAAQHIARQGVLGLVTDFDAAMGRLSRILRPIFPEFKWQPVTANASDKGTARDISPQMRDILIAHNADDLALIDYARDLISRASMDRRTPQPAGMV